MKIEYLTSHSEDVYVRVPNISAAQDDLDFSPQVSLVDGLDSYIEWVKRSSFKTLQS